VDGTYFTIGDKQLPVYFTSYIDNGQPYKLGIPEYNEREFEFMKINGVEFEKQEHPPALLADDERELSRL
jgi:hypothetical protein